MPFAKFNEHFARSRVFAANQFVSKAINATPEAATKALAIWAANGGRATAISPAITDSGLARMQDNGPGFRPSVVEDDGLQDHLDKDQPIEVDKAKQAAAKLTAADVDKALEAALSGWQGAGQEGPMPLSKLFAARARQLGWVEDVEFVEKNESRLPVSIFMDRHLCDCY